MITVANPVGRLVALRFASPLDAAEIDAFARAVHDLNARLDRVVVVADFSALLVLDGELADRIEDEMRAANPRVERSALLLPSSAVSQLQTGRLIREAGHPMRRGFRAVEPLLAWIAPSLSPDEAIAARAFLVPLPG
jgi:hypothetical protein